ncbi:hypothetical protein ABK040_005249 [Willaertia magna]
MQTTVSGSHSQSSSNPGISGSSTQHHTYTLQQQQKFIETAILNLEQLIENYFNKIENSFEEPFTKEEALIEHKKIVKALSSLNQLIDRFDLSHIFINQSLAEDEEQRMKKENEKEEKKQSLARIARNSNTVLEYLSKFDFMQEE